MVATAAVVLMIVGLWGMSFYSSPSFSTNYEQVHSIASLVDIVPPAAGGSGLSTGSGSGCEEYRRSNNDNGNVTSIDHGDGSYSSGLFSHVTNHISLSPTRSVSRSITRDQDDYEVVHSPFGSYDDHSEEIGDAKDDPGATTIPNKINDHDYEDEDEDEETSMEHSTGNDHNNIHDYNDQNYHDSMSYTSSITPTSDLAGAVHQRKSKLKSRSSSFSLSLSRHDSDTKATTTTTNSTAHQHYLEDRTTTDEYDQDNKDYFFEHPTLDSNKNGNPTLNSALTPTPPSLQEAHLQYQNTRRPVVLSKRTLGLLSAIFNGVWGGSIMVPMHYAPREAHGTGYVISFAIGATIITICLWAGRFLYHYIYQKKTIKLSYDSLPPFHFRVMWKPGGTAGLLWSIGNLSSMISVQYLGEGVGYSLTQASMLVSGVWGIFYFREVEGLSVRVKWFVSALITITGILLLSFEHVDDGGEVSGSGDGI